MAKTIKDSIAKSVKKPSKTASKKINKADPADWYAKAKASIAISKTDEPLPPDKAMVASVQQKIQAMRDRLKAVRQSQKR